MLLHINYPNLAGKRFLPIYFSARAVYRIFTGRAVHAAAVVCRLSYRQTANDV